MFGRLQKIPKEGRRGKRRRSRQFKKVSVTGCLKSVGVSTKQAADKLKYEKIKLFAGQKEKSIYN